jgi:hypothetical protein
MADRPTEIVYTGLRPGEKLHEVLFGPGERDQRPSHPLISQVPVPPLDAAVISLLDAAAPAEDLIAMLRWIANSPALSPARDTNAVTSAAKLWQPRLRERVLTLRDPVRPGIPTRTRPS